MMKNTLWVVGLAMLLMLAGCNGGSDRGDIKRAEEATKKARETVNNLPADMPGQAKAQAQAAQAQQDAMSQSMQQQNDAMKRAMQEMQRQKQGQ